MLTQQQIIALAVEAGAIPASDGEYFPSELIICESMFETFAMAAYQRGVRDERDACAKLCEPQSGIKYSPNSLSARQHCADRIRDRSDK